MADLSKQPDGTWKFTNSDSEAFVVEMERARYIDHNLPLPQWIIEWDKAQEEKV